MEIETEIDAEFDNCICRGEWINEGWLKTISICKYCQNIMRESGMSDDEIEIEVKSLGLVLDS